MKKFIFVLLFLLMPFMVKAVDIGINDTDINSITFNDNWVVITRDNYQEVLSNYDFSEDDINSTYNNYINNNYYIDAFTPDYNKEIILIYKKETSDVDNMSDLTEDEIISETTFLRNKYKAYGASEDIYKTSDGVKYLKMFYLDNGMGVYIIDYITVFNNYLYQFKVQSKNEFTESDINEIETIIDSVSYGDDINVLPADTQKLISNNTSDNKDNEINTKVIKYILIAFGGVIILGCIVAVVLANNNKKKIFKNM